MIELLVVIAVIGVLAVAVLSSINPIEQINKGRDTRTRSDAAQLINAIDRYFSIHETYPWNTDNADVGYTAPTADYQDEFIYDETGLSGLTNSVNTWDWVDVLADTAEVKSGFTNRLKTDDGTDYVLYKPGTANATLYSCYLPASNAFRVEAKTRCDEGGVDADVESFACPATCLGPDGDSTTCMVCLP